MLTFMSLFISLTDSNSAFQQVYLPAIEGYMPYEMVKALQAFLDFCYIVQHDIHDTQSLWKLEDTLDYFHKYHEIVRTTTVHPKGFNLPCSHVAVYYICPI